MSISLRVNFSSLTCLIFVTVVLSENLFLLFILLTIVFFKLSIPLFFIAEIKAKSFNLVLILVFRSDLLTTVII